MPNSVFNVPRGSFPTPQKPVGVGPLVGPLVQVQFNYKWCSLIVGSLSQLLLNTTWDVSSQAELTAIQEDVFDLMSAFCFEPISAFSTPSAGAGGGDDFMLRQNPLNPCELQTSVDGVTWCTWADLSKCLGAPPQPGPGSPQPLPGGGCQTYHAVLPASGKWLAPTFVNSGDTVHVTNVQGVWNGGTINWYCPDGTPFVGFLCIGVGGVISGDPDPTVNHMALIAGLSGGLFFPVMGGSVTIPGGVVAQTIEFQANDSILTDNAGQIEFDVAICNNQAGSWSSTFDFLSNPYTSIFTPVYGAWTVGVGYQGTAVGGFPFAVELHSVIAATMISSMTETYTAGAHGGASDDTHFQLNVTIYGAVNPMVTGTGVIWFNAANFTGATDVYCNLNSGTAGAQFQLTRLVVTGQGSKPVGWP
jgi:hypothetical protein